MIYARFTRFLLPLVFAMIVLELSVQVLNGGMARVPRATETLASFGLAWGLVNFLTSSLSQARQLGLVLVDSHAAMGKVRAFVLTFGLLLAGLLVCLAITPMGTRVIEDLHGVGRPMSAVVRYALFYLVPIPLLRGISLLYSGCLLRVRRTEVVSAAAIAAIGASVLTVFALLPLGFVRAQPIRLPILVTYAGTLVELAIVLWGYTRYVRRILKPAGEMLTLSYVVRFFWPLALIMAIQGLSRPLINLFVSREPDGAEALAVLTVVYALGHLPYAWLNETRSLAPVFKDRENSLAHIRRFMAGCCLLSFGIAVAVSWTSLRPIILRDLIGIDAHLVPLCRDSLIIFSFFPFAVTVRAYFHGVGLLEHRTKAMAPSAPARIGAIWAALMVLPILGVHGATRGVAALLCGFVLETIAVWCGVRQKTVTSHESRNSGESKA